jgi:hypothetical protein
MRKKIQNVYLVLLIILLISCQGSKNPCSLSEAVLQDINRMDSLIGIPELQDRDRNWMKDNYNESSIIHADNETYRFIWSSSFDGTEIYRIEKKDNAFKAIVKLFGQDDTIGKFTEFNISKEVWNNITDSLHETNFWTYPSSIDRNGLDGASWLLEGYKPIEDKCTLKKYHRIGRWSPIDKQFVSMCELFYQLKPKQYRKTEYY